MERHYNSVCLRNYVDVNALTHARRLWMCKRDLLKNHDQHLNTVATRHRSPSFQLHSLPLIPYIKCIEMANASSLKKQTHTHKMKHELVINNMIKLQSNCSCCCCCSNQLLRHFISFNFLYVCLLLAGWLSKHQTELRSIAPVHKTYKLHSVVIKIGFNIYIFRLAHSFFIQYFAIVFDSRTRFISICTMYEHTHKLFAHWKMLNVCYLVFN